MSEKIIAVLQDTSSGQFLECGSYTKVQIGKMNAKIRGLGKRWIYHSWLLAKEKEIILRDFGVGDGVTHA